MRYGALLAVALLLLAFLGVILIRYYVLQTDRDLESSGIPLYFGSERRMILRIDEEKAAELVQSVRESYSITEGKAIVMFGITTCPYCKMQHEALSPNPPAKYVAIWIDRDEKGRELFIKLLEAESGAGAPLEEIGGVPHTVVIYDNSIKAIVVGRVTDRSFWASLVR